ncbi:MAG: HEAT repeat domain-containing protein [Planctomycetia bacterium]|nr:HEAT repeat domain-containing protein [Planctomycetia bacterium]
MRRTLVLTAGCAVALLAAHPAAGIGPESPEVKKAVEDGLEYLRTAEYGRLGGKALVGLAFLKAGKDKNEPKVQEALQAVLATAKAGPDAYSEGLIYDAGVCIMFLVAMDPSKYRQEIEVYVKALHRLQKRPGAWGYPVSNEANGKTCDTSMTQYAVLGLWEAADLSGIETPPRVWERAADWLISTQAPDGGWSYQGTPGSLDQRVKQGAVTDTLTVAAMGALYIVRNQLGHGQLRKRDDDDTPAALQPYESEEERKKRLKTTIELKYFQRAITAGNTWITQHYKRRPEKGWIYYYFYAMERYQSLREADLHVRPKNPTWYQEGASFIVEEQRADGSWQAQENMSVPDTAFAILFLLRSTQRSLDKSLIRRHQSSVLVAGSGFPDKPGVRLRDGEIVVKPLEAPLEKVLQIIDNPRHEQYAAAREALADQARKGDVEVLAKHASALARLAQRGERPVRLSAIEGLGRSRNLDQVPALIQLLSDDDLDVVQAAESALRLISRKPDGFGLVLRPSAEQKKSAMKKWSEWYSSIRPDAAVGGGS